MKEWSSPQMKEFKVSNTEYMAPQGTHVDGHYVSNDGKYDIPTYSGEGNGPIIIPTLGG